MNPADDARRDDPPLPIPLERVSNGEYVPPPLSPAVEEAVRRSLDHVDRNARRYGMDRRTFLRSTMGAASMLFFLNACSKDEARSTGREPGGTFSVPSSATTDPDTARTTVAPFPDEFVFDVQTHLLEYDLTGGGPSFGRGFPQASCDADDWRTCFDVEHWLDEVFVRSDTALAVISAVPVLSDPNPLSIAVMENARRAADQVCGDGRVLLHGQVNPNVGDLGAALDGMARLVQEHPIAAWKAYTHVPGDRGWFFDDSDPDGVQCGQRFLDQVRAVGPPIVCVHKGFGGGSAYSSPVDIGPAAVANPDLAFVVYHSGYDGPEGPFTDDTADVGVNRLLASLRDASVAPGANVYAELGSTWFNAMRDPTQAAHVLGKLLLAVGEDNIVWGTDSIWYGSPQGQIEAFRTFEITEQLQEEHGYPPLTADAKRKILGANSARVYGIEPADVPATCDADREALEELRLAMPASRPMGPRTAAEVRALLDAHGGLA